ncbi:hypothetical protein, partial [Actinoplanes philippinensis]|uniref:hypothetical protein n=1 Tax=Actinoplanes philippinensis TaxID=35752 RepID=UPI00348CAB19
MNTAGSYDGATTAWAPTADQQGRAQQGWSRTEHGSGTGWPPPEQAGTPAAPADWLPGDRQAGDRQGVDRQGVDRQGVDRQGVDRQGVDRQGVDR